MNHRISDLTNESEKLKTKIQQAERDKKTTEAFRLKHEQDRINREKDELIRKGRSKL